MQEQIIIWKPVHKGMRVSNQYQEDLPKDGEYVLIKTEIGIFGGWFYVGLMNSWSFDWYDFDGCEVPYQYDVMFDYAGKQTGPKVFEWARIN